MAKRSTSKPAARRKGSPLDSELLQRVVIEGVRPEVDGGRFPVKRTPGEPVIVTADVHADGHDVLAAVLRFRRTGDPEWSEAPMEPLGNDRWTARFEIEVIGRYEYTLEAWIDRFATWRSELSKKFGAGQDVTAELLEGADIIDTVEAAREAAEQVRDTSIPRRSTGRCRP